MTASTYVQAAHAYDAAARSIRGDSAICNFPENEQEAANAHRYHDRMAATQRKRRPGTAAGTASAGRRLTARQKAKFGPGDGGAGGADDSGASADTPNAPPDGEERDDLLEDGVAMRAHSLPLRPHSIDGVTTSGEAASSDAPALAPKRTLLKSASARRGSKPRGVQQQAQQHLQQRTYMAVPHQMYFPSHSALLPWQFESPLPLRPHLLHPYDGQCLQGDVSALRFMHHSRFVMLCSMRLAV